MQLNSCGAVWRCLTSVSKQHLVTECLHTIGLITHELLMNLRSIHNSTLMNTVERWSLSCNDSLMSVILVGVVINCFKFISNIKFSNVQPSGQTFRRLQLRSPGISMWACSTLRLEYNLALECFRSMTLGIQEVCRIHMTDYYRS
jgi:hypothetical protein